MSTDEVIPDEELYIKYPHLYQGLGFIHQLSTPTHTTTSTNIATDSGLTVDEQRVYDRQIRTWGVEAQNKMRQANVLIIGHINGLGAEICKNLTLAGIGSLTLCDNILCTSESFEYNFLLGEQYGEFAYQKCNENNNDNKDDNKDDNNHNNKIESPINRLTEGQASLPGLRALNPNVIINHVTKPKGGIDKLFLPIHEASTPESMATPHTRSLNESINDPINIINYTMIIACGIDILDAVYLNHLCRLVGGTTRYSPKFVYTDLHNHYGIGFFDWNYNHNFFVPTAVAVEKRKEKSNKSANPNDTNGTYYTANSVSLGTSLHLIGLDIDDMMKVRNNVITTTTNNLNHTNESNNNIDGNDVKYQISVPFINSDEFIARCKVDSGLINTNNVTYIPESYFGKVKVPTPPHHDLNKMNNNTNDKINCDDKRYEPFKPPSSRNACRILSYAYVVNYFVNGLCAQTHHTDQEPQHYPTNLNKNDHDPTNVTDSITTKQPLSLYTRLVTNDGITNGLETTPYCAILGGMLTQEILKSFQQGVQTAVRYNWMCLDMFQRTGECVPIRIM